MLHRPVEGDELPPMKTYCRDVFCSNHSCDETCSVMANEGHTAISDAAMAAALRTAQWGEGRGGILRTPICPKCTKRRDRNLRAKGLQSLY